jgi:RNA polymerase sigma-70 factor (ECF subfamily)
MRGEQETAAAIDRHADMVRRLCLIHLKNQADSEDVFQTVFMKYVLSSAVFENEEHEKAWFIRVTINACRDLLRSFFRSRTVPLDELIDLPADAPSESRAVLEAVLELPGKYRDVVYLHYFEGYTAPEIAGLMKKNVNTVYSLLARAKKLLKERLGGDEDA